MNFRFSLMGIAVLVILLVCAAGCTSTTSSSSPATSATPSPAPAGTTAASSAAVTATTVAATGTSTTVSVHYNDYSCTDLQQLFNVEYLNPGEVYTITVSPPSGGGITPNLLVLDVTDNTKLLSVKPVWDSVQKTWVYSGIVPIVKIFDITSPQIRTLTIEDQGHYYLCIDDRKEAGSSDAVYQVPVQIIKV